MLNRYAEVLFVDAGFAPAFNQQDRHRYRTVYCLFPSVFTRHCMASVDDGAMTSRVADRGDTPVCDYL